MNFIVVAYYTEDTFYADVVKNLKASLIKFNVPHHIKPIKNLGDWHSNTAYKPTFIKEMMQTYKDKNIVYVDADAVFCGFPELFKTLDCDLAAYKLDRKTVYKKRQGSPELLSGTLFFKNNDYCLNIINRWEKLCIRNKKVWDQKNLEEIIGFNFYELPDQYCVIFDLMAYVKKPIIVHYQASRKVRKNKWKLV